MQTDGYAALNFIENMEYKFIELFTVDFMASTEESIRLNISFRYNCLKAKLLYMQNRLKEIHSIIKLKNPSLLMQMHRNFDQNKSMLQATMNNSKIMNTSKILNSSKLK